ncbi:hypothetical protein C8R44DRAFT_806529, partial [Mycena epipterygia]
MQSTSTTIPTVQRTTAPATVTTTPASMSAEAVIVNHNGPQCCHCGWRGGEHASNCPFK